MPPKFRRYLSEEDVTEAAEPEKEKLLQDEDEDFFLKGPTSSGKTLTIQDKKLRSDCRRVFDDVKHKNGCDMLQIMRMCPTRRKHSNKIYCIGYGSRFLFPTVSMAKKVCTSCSNSMAVAFCS
ncbi:uncharacterized protein LOC142586123 isoform X2 [Dermacentor variabilis]|uniref:uncharacterized protein LOC142586123 isoform X2 n=1 Tax=Dermacentor variabilis TaxID=34621 RepID=UPI003F5B16C0